MLDDPTGKQKQVTIIIYIVSLLFHFFFISLHLLSHYLTHHLSLSLHLTHYLDISLDQLQLNRYQLLHAVQTIIINLLDVSICNNTISRVFTAL